MSDTVVVNVRGDGTRRLTGHLYDVSISRPSKWGNPFVIGRDGAREEVIAKYREYILGRPDLLAALPELRGKRLGCWCAPKACHGDVLVELLRGEG
ncbi:MAG: hypothetical protein A3E01_15280 [Gammaproteobacteria bacterium RIFCSPHIGHO2_12_FULL_63_22]|nr:MAG: hypothetical protein A3E01_15280 [Gammaproteobacteria bacterium RIFCSPHIGHO2_12_FULL_63_22]